MPFGRGLLAPLRGAWGCVARRVRGWYPRLISRHPCGVPSPRLAGQFSSAVTN